MKINCNTLENRFRTEFPGIYTAFSQFIDSGPLWDEFRKVMADKEMMSHIVFCNDVLRLQPVYIHLMVSKYVGGEAASRVLTDVEKQSLGAAYGYLFQTVMGYTNMERKNCAFPNIRTAALFSREDKILIEFVNEVGA